MKGLLRNINFCRNLISHSTKIGYSNVFRSNRVIDTELAELRHFSEFSCVNPMLIKISCISLMQTHILM